MSDNMNIPEKVRGKIDDTIREALIGLPKAPEQIIHMLTSICFEMYRTGWNDAFRLVEKTIEKEKEIFTK